MTVSFCFYGYMILPIMLFLVVTVRMYWCSLVLNRWL